MVSKKTGRFVKLEKLQGKDILEIAEALPGDGKARMIDAAGVILPTKSHSQLKPSLNGLMVVTALIAFLDRELDEDEYWSPR